MADGIDIRIKRAVYLDSKTHLPKEEIANYRLLYGEMIYLIDKDFLVIGKKGYVEYTDTATNTKKSATTNTKPITMTKTIKRNSLLSFRSYNLGCYQRFRSRIRARYFC